MICAICGTRLNTSPVAQDLFLPKDISSLNANEGLGKFTGVRQDFQLLRESEISPSCENLDSSFCCRKSNKRQRRQISNRSEIDHEANASPKRSKRLSCKKGKATRTKRKPARRDSLSESLPVGDEDHATLSDNSDENDLQAPECLAQSAASFKVKEIPPLHTARTSSYRSGDIPVNRVGPSTPRRKDFHVGLSNDVGDFDSPASSHSMLETPNSTQNSIGKQRDDDISVVPKT